MAARWSAASHVVTIAGEQKRSTEAAYASADDDNDHEVPIMAASEEASS
jgi:hypothetical protein